MNRIDTQTETTMGELVEQATDLAARAMACGIARLIERYVPPRLADRFAMRVAVVLLREVHAREEAVVRSPFATEH